MMTSRKDWMLLAVFGLCMSSAVLIQGHVAEAKAYDYGKPVITTVSEQIDVVEGDDIRLECKGHHFDNYALIWIKLPDTIISIDGERMRPYNTPRYDLQSMGTVLMIKNSLRNDSGSYSCTIFQNVTVVHNVTVRARNPNQLLPPYMSINPDNLITTTQHEFINLTCTVRTEGQQIEFYWLKKNPERQQIIFDWQQSNDLKLANTIITRPSRTVVENKLMLTWVSRLDAGDYLCFFKDSIGTAENTVRLIVKFPPIVEARRDAVHAVIGRPLELQCVVYAVPNAELKWYKSDRNDRNKLIPVIQRYGYQMRSHQHTHYLFIINLTENDFGTYTCEATNGFAQAGVATIDVVGAPGQPLLVEHKTRLGHEPMSYHLVWKVESSIPIERNVLRYKKVPGTQWTDINVEGIRIPNQPLFVEVAYTLTNLSSSSTYETTLQSWNKLGWSAPARIHRFLSQEHYTNTMDLSNDKVLLSIESKAPSQIESSGFLIISSIFLLLVEFIFEVVNPNIWQTFGSVS